MSVNYARMCYIFSNAIEKSLRYLPDIPETTIARYLLQWSLYEAKDIFAQSLPKFEGLPAPRDVSVIDINAWFAADKFDYCDFEKLIDYDYFDDPSEDLSGIDLTGFFPDDKPRKFQYRYGPKKDE